MKICLFDNKLHTMILTIVRDTKLIHEFGFSLTFLYPYNLPLISSESIINHEFHSVPEGAEHGKAHDQN